MSENVDVNHKIAVSTISSSFKPAVLISFGLVAVAGIAAAFAVWPACISFGLTAIVMSIWNAANMICAELRKREEGDGKR